MHDDLIHRLVDLAGPLERFDDGLGEHRRRVPLERHAHDRRRRVVIGRVPWLPEHLRRNGFECARRAAHASSDGGAGGIDTGDREQTRLDAPVVSGEGSEVSTHAGGRDAQRRDGVVVIEVEEHGGHGRGGHGGSECRQAPARFRRSWHQSVGEASGDRVADGYRLQQLGGVVGALQRKRRRYDHEPGVRGRAVGVLPVEGVHEQGVGDDRRRGVGAPLQPADLGVALTGAQRAGDVSPAWVTRRTDHLHHADAQAVDRARPDLVSRCVL